MTDFHRFNCNFFNSQRQRKLLITANHIGHSNCTDDFLLMNSIMSRSNASTGLFVMIIYCHSLTLDNRFYCHRTSVGQLSVHLSFVEPGAIKLKCNKCLKQFFIDLRESYIDYIYSLDYNRSQKVHCVHCFRRDNCILCLFVVVWT